MAKSFSMIKKTPDPKKPSFSVMRTKTTKSYNPEDARTGAPSYGKESATKPAPEFIKKAQAEKKDIVNKDGKAFRSGRTSFEHDYAMSVNMEKPDVKSLKVPEKSFSVIKKEKVAPARNSGKVPVRKMERVNYLQGKNPGKLSSFEGRKRPKKESGY